MARANIGRSRRYRFWGFCALAFLSAGSIAAPSQQVGDWYYSLNGDISEAYTASNSGATLGMLCSRSLNSCSLYLRSEDSCDAGATIPVLVNAPNGSESLTATCRVLNTASGTIDALVLTLLADGTLSADGHFIGFALPMVNGAFHVYRFSTTGASTAIAAVTSSAEMPVGDQSF